MKIQLSLSAAQSLYHVTLTANVPSIKKKGLMPLQTSNWVKAGNKDRYGGGYIFAFTHLADAIRWAAKMDWKFNQKWGSGKISIATLESDPKEWNVDDADPLTQSSAKGKWLKRKQAVPASAINAAVPFTQELLKKVLSL